MKYCISCLQPDTRPNTVFTGDGRCPACNYYEELQSVDWEERYETIVSLVKRYKSVTDRHFDCIIGVSGGKDSTRQALWVREKLGLKPLLVSLTHSPQQVSHLGAGNISNLIDLGFDVIISAPAPETWRQLMRRSFFKFSNWARSSELALFSSVPQLAISHEIPLIFWGESPAQVGDLSAVGKFGYDGNHLRYSNTLSSGHLWMLNEGYKMSEIIPYIYPEKEDFERVDIQIVCLGWVLGDWSLLDNAAHACAAGLNIRERQPELTGDLYGLSNLDEDWHNMNQMIKFYKFGFGKTTEYVNEELRRGVLSRKEAIEIVEQYDGKCSDEYIRSFCNYIEISENCFWENIYNCVNKDLFTVTGSGKILRKFQVGVGL